MTPAELAFIHDQVLLTAQNTVAAFEHHRFQPECEQPPIEPLREAIESAVTDDTPTGTTQHAMLVAELIKELAFSVPHHYAPETYVPLIPRGINKKKGADRANSALRKAWYVSHNYLRFMKRLKAQNHEDLKRK